MLTMTAPATTAICPAQRTGSWDDDEQQPLRLTNQDELLRQLAAGDPVTWSNTVARYTARLRAVARAYRLTGAEVDDALQATWMSLFRHAEQVRDTDRLGAWLASTMRRACLRVLCSGNRRRDELVDDWSRYEVSQTVATQEDVHRRVELADEVASVWGLVDQLSPRHRELLRALYSAEEPSYAAISARTGIPVGAIGPTRQRALAQLRRLVTDTADEQVSRRVA